jgi:hypothetical protein
MNTMFLPVSSRNLLLVKDFRVKKNSLTANLASLPFALKLQTRSSQLNCSWEVLIEEMNTVRWREGMLVRRRYWKREESMDGYWASAGWGSLIQGESSTGWSIRSS